MAKVFVSYSRKDITFAKRLTAELQKCEFDFWIDWEGIPPTVDWWREIEKGIEEADVFVFLISPDSAKSKVCGQEIDTAVRNGKRVIPIVVRDIPWEDTPKHLGHLNYIFIRESDDFNAAVNKLTTAIQTDYEWAATHRRLQVKALDWERNNKESGFLLRGLDLLDAEQDLALNTSKEPHPTDLQREYVFESRKSTDRQKRITTWIAIATAIALAGLAVFGFYQADVATKRATVSRSQVLATSAQVDKSKPQQNILLSVEAMKLVKDYPFSDRAIAVRTFHDSLNLVGGTPLPGYTGIVQMFSISPDGQWLATVGGDKTIRLGMISEPLAEPRELKVPGEIHALIFSSDSRWLAAGGCEAAVEDDSGCGEGKVHFWDTKDPSAELLVWKNEGGAILKLAFSLDGHWLAAGNEGGTTLLWNLRDQTAKPILLKGHTRYMTALTFSADSQWLATGSRDNTIRLWRINERPFKSILLDEQPNAIDSLAFSPNGEWLAAVIVRENTVPVWRVNEASAKPIVLQGHEDFVRSLAFSPDGEWLATGSFDYKVGLWSVKTNFQEFDILEMHEGAVNTLAFSSDSQWLATGSSDNTIRLWNMKTKSSPAILRGHEDIVYDLAFVPDSQQLITVSSDQIPRLWNASHPYAGRIDLQINAGTIDHLAFSPDGKWVAAGGCSDTGEAGSPCAQGGLWIWRTEDISAQPLELQSQKGWVNTLTFSPDGQWLATANVDDNSPHLWNMNDMSAKPIVLKGSDNLVTGLAFSADGQWLAIQAIGDEGIVTHLLNMRDPSAKLIVLEKHGGTFSTFAISPDGQWLVTAHDASNTAQLWNLVSMSATPVVLEGNNDGINSVAFSPDNRWLAVASYGNLIYNGNELHSDNTVHLWRFKEPFSKHIDLKMGDEDISQLAFSPDGKWLALDYSLRNMENPSQALESTPFFSIFSPDSQWLSDAGPPRIWNINSPNSEPILLSSGEGYAGPVAFSPDGHWLVISNSENVGLWNLNYDTLMETACHVVGRNFSRAEWNRYFPNEEYRKTCDQWEPEVTLTPTP